MWGAGTRANSSGAGSKSTDLDASEVLDSATRWLAAEGVNSLSSFRTSSKAPQIRGANSKDTDDAPPALETSIWRRPSETRLVSTNENKEGAVDRVSGSPVRSRVFTSERPQFAPVPETAPLPPARPQRSSVPPRPEQSRRFVTANERPAETTDGFPRGKKKRGRDVASTPIIEGVEGLGQRLKRVCIKAKFHRRARHHLSSEDLSMVGTREVVPAPITPPDQKKETQVYDSPHSPNKKATSSRTLVTGGMSANQGGVISVTSHSLVTGIVDARDETVKTQTSPENKNSPAKAPVQTRQNIFLQPKVSGKGVLDSLESEHEIIFTESTTSEEEFAA